MKGPNDLIDRQHLQEIAGLFKDTLNVAAGKEMQFIMLVLDAGPEGSLQYISTVNRVDAIAVLREFLAAQAREYGAAN